jgi:hypothetical protein
MKNVFGITPMPPSEELQLFDLAKPLIAFGIIMRGKTSAINEAAASRTLTVFYINRMSMFPSTIYGPKVLAGALDSSVLKPLAQYIESRNTII